LAIASVRLATPSLANVFSRCLRTVPGESWSWRAIAWLVWPAATSCRSSRCRAVRDRVAARRACRRSTSAMCGWSSVAA